MLFFILLSYFTGVYGVGRAFCKLCCIRRIPHFVYAPLLHDTSYVLPFCFFNVSLATRFMMNGCRVLREEFSLSFLSLFRSSYSFPHLIRFSCTNRVGYHTVPLLVFFPSFYTFLLHECTSFYLFLSFF